jgi:hypothetical protein
VLAAAAELGNERISCILSSSRGDDYSGSPNLSLGRVKSLYIETGDSNRWVGALAAEVERLQFLPDGTSD